MRFSSLLIGAILQGHVAAQTARGPTIIGDSVTITISPDSSGSYIKPSTNLDGSSKTYQYSHLGSSYIAVHFKEFDFPSGCFMEISDKSGGQSYQLTGKGTFDQGTFWPRQVNGDTILLTQTCDEAGKMSDAIFEIDKVTHGHYETKNKEVETESICGTDDKKNAICFKSSHETIYGKSRAVGRVVIGGGGLCTGWLVSGSNLMLTNEHCIATDSVAKNSNIEFMREEPRCGVNGAPEGGEKFQISGLVKVNAAWDFALLQIDTSDGSDPAAKYGYLELDNRKPAVGELLYIPQHPGGRPKELGFEDSNEADKKCKVKGYGRGCSSEDMRYSCDTEGGSSGSPVLSRVTNKVVALHHCGGGCNGNLGAPIYKFYDMLELGSSAPTVSPKPTVRPTTVAPTGVPSTAPSAPSSSFGPTPVAYGTGEPTGNNGSTKSPTTSPSGTPSETPSETPSASPTKAKQDVCKGKNKRQCKKVKESCSFGKAKIFGECVAKKKKYEHDCTEYINSSECSSDNNHGGLCEMKGESCSHVCDGFAKRQCVRFKTDPNDGDGNKTCKAPKKKNPCKGCQPNNCGE